MSRYLATMILSECSVHISCY